MTQTSLHFIVGRQPLDLLQLAFQVSRGDEATPLIMTSDGAACAAACGTRLASGYMGLMAWVADHVEPAFQKVKRKERHLDILFGPSGELSSSGLAEYLDRARPSLGQFKEVLVAMTFSRLPLDLPPLAPQDKLTCFWEVRDALDDSLLQSFCHLQQRLDHEATAFGGFQLFTRKPLPDPEVETRAEELIEASGLCPSGKILTLN